jgi:hypothetical protein
MFRQLRGLKALVHDAVDLTTDLIELGHQSVGGHVTRLLDLLAPGDLPAGLADDVQRAATALSLGPVRVVNRLVRTVTDVGLDVAEAQAERPVPPARLSPIPMRSDITGTRPWLADATLAALNGAVGDYLHREGNALDMGFWLRHQDRYLSLREQPSPTVAAPGELPPAPPGPRRVLLVHGLGASEWSWCLGAAEGLGDPAANVGTLLRRDRGLEPLFARYNSGRRVAENGRLLADGLERCLQEWTAQGSPTTELVLIGHSMGGLVLRAACHHARQHGQAWIGHVNHLFCIGSPHQGAPLEKFGHVLTKVLSSIDLPGTQIPAEILRRRSAGIQDLRHGSITDDVADELNSATLATELDGLTVHFASGSITDDRTHPLGQLLGDTLVRVQSASGPRAATPRPAADITCFGGVMHHELQSHPEVYAWILKGVPT